MPAWRAARACRGTCSTGPRPRLQRSAHAGAPASPRPAPVSRRSSSGARYAPPPCRSEYVTRARERRPTGVRRARAELLLDPHELVVLGDAIGARGSARLDLSGAERDREVGNGRILGLARAMGHHRAVTMTLREPHRFDRLRERPDLVHLDED